MGDFPPDVMKDLISGSCNGLLLVDDAGSVIACSPQVESMTGVTPEALEADALALTEALDPVSGDLYVGALRLLPALVASEDVELATRDGRWLRMRLHRLRADRVHLSLQDISQRKRLSSRLAVVFERSMDGLAILDADGCFVRVNEAYCSMVGRDAEELRQSSLADLEQLESPELVRERLQAVRVQGSDRFETIHRHSDGSHVGLEVVITFLNESGGSYFCNFRDTAVREHLATDRKERHFHQHLETIGTLAGGIAHDLNNVLAPIIGYADLLAAKHASESPDGRKIRKIGSAGRRAAELVRQVLTFSRQTAQELAEIDLLPVASELVLEHALDVRRVGEPVQVCSAIPDQLRPVLGDADQLRQLMDRLVVNARQALRATAGGAVTVSLDEDYFEAGSGSQPSVRRNGWHVRLQVRDDGEGMPPSVRERAIEPFFSTRKDASGLGLSVVHGIVIALKGAMHIDSREGSGTTVTVLLPAAADAMASGELRIRSPLPDQLGAPAGGNERILLVDDERDICDLLQETLQASGYRVTSLTDPLQATDFLQRYPSAVDLVITDQRMPGIDGVELTRRVHQQDADMPVIMVSGFAEEVHGHNYQRYGLVDFLAKPVDARLLLAAVRKALDRRQPKGPIDVASSS